MFGLQRVVLGWLSQPTGDFSTNLRQGVKGFGEFRTHGFWVCQPVASTPILSREPEGTPSQNTRKGTRGVQPDRKSVV